MIKSQKMKATFLTRTILLAGAFIFIVLTCSGQDDPPEVVATWTKSTNMGSVTLVVKPDQTWEVKFTGGEDPDVFGSYTISGKQITFTDEGGDYSSDTSGVYEFTLGDGSITFKKIDDPSEGRSTLVIGEWSKALDER